ncbi:cytochrome P450 [Mycena rebaudengoi]|nr:cytochrome P450 [Mycena rebaudengoi]
MQVEKWLFIAIAAVPVKDGISAYRVYWLPRVTMGGNLLDNVLPTQRRAWPLYATISDAWFNSHFLRYNQAQALHKLFQCYGSVVRVGPQKIVFCDLDLMRNVYNIQRFEKSPILKILDNAAHAAWRKAVGSHYAAANVARMEPIIRKSTLEAIHHLQSAKGQTAVDCLDLLRILMLDITAYSSFGYTIGGVRNWTLNSPSRLSVSIADFAKMIILSSICNTWVWRAICLVPHKRVALFTRSIPFLKQFVAAKVQEAQQQLKRGEEFESLPLAHRLLMYRQSSTNEALSSEAVTAEIIAHLLAGSEPMSATLAYFLWEISHNPEALHKLRVEIDAIMPDPGVIPDLTVLQELPYLTAFIQEGLRVYTVIPSLLERVVPATGNFDLMGYSLPPGTVVGTQAWPMHKDPAVFPNPECFSPQRWLDGAEPWRSLREEHLMPFGLGSRA